jgi:ribosomal-protein-alanine N-acetyltransferase
MVFLKLQPLTMDLIPAAVQLDQQCLGGLWKEEGYQREIESPNSDLLVLQSSLLSQNHPSIIGLGCLWAIVEEAHITILAVHPDYRQQGLGQILLFTLMAIAHARKLEWATLEVRASNQSAIALYQKFGFEPVGTRRKYYQDTGEDALILWRKGLQKPEFQQTLKNWGQAVGDRLQQSTWDFLISADLSLPIPFPLD